VTYEGRVIDFKVCKNWGIWLKLFRSEMLIIRTLLELDAHNVAYFKYKKYVLKKNENNDKNIC